MELMGCADLAVPADVMHHVVRVESSFNPYAIGVVGGRLARQPANLSEAVATARMLERRGFNFSLGLAQVNRYNLSRYGLESYEQAFQACPNLRAGARILAECHDRSGRDWGKSFSCYYSGNFVTGFRQGYVQKIYASMRGSTGPDDASAIPVYGTPTVRRPAKAPHWRMAGEKPSRVEPVLATAAPALRDAQPVAAPPAARIAPSEATADAGLAVLRRDGAPPRIAETTSVTPPPPATDVPPRDAAFVF